MATYDLILNIVSYFRVREDYPDQADIRINAITMDGDVFRLGILEAKQTKKMAQPIRRTTWDTYLIIYVALLQTGHPPIDLIIVEPLTSSSSRHSTCEQVAHMEPNLSHNPPLPFHPLPSPIFFPSFHLSTFPSFLPPQTYSPHSPFLSFSLSPLLPFPALPSPTCHPVQPTSPSVQPTRHKQDAKDAGEKATKRGGVDREKTAGRQNYAPYLPTHPRNNKTKTKERKKGGKEKKRKGAFNRYKLPT